MAVFEVNLPEDFLGDLLKSDFDQICEEGLREAVPILEDSIKKSLRSVIEHEGDSELVESVKSSKPKKAKTGAWIANVNPKGYSEHTYNDKRTPGRMVKRPVSNALKAIWKEYGVNGRQAPRPFLAKAVNDAREAALDKIQETYNRKVGAE